MTSSEESDATPVAAKADDSEINPTAQALTKMVERSQKLMSHAWMIRTFVKHSDEVDVPGTKRNGSDDF